MFWRIAMFRITHLRAFRAAWAAFQGALAVSASLLGAWVVNAVM